MTEGTEDGRDHVLSARGKHKIFLGYAPGVGKTFTMLSEAHRRQARGEDIVVGFVEPHKREETLALLHGLPTVPTKKIEYRGRIFEEMDTEAVIVRKPQWALVDELAHTNVPGTDHAKRWQSVEDILDAGINVISTVNIQHFESLNDVVEQITGVKVRETLPDSIIDEADEVVLVDLTPDALMNRLKRGVIYDEEKVPQALQKFFRKGNLSALRELSLRKTAEEVDEELLEYMRDQDIRETWGAQDRVLVAVRAHPMAQKLVRRGYTLARRLQGRFWAVFVRPSGLAVSEGAARSLRAVEALTKELGGEYVELAGDSTAEALVDFAKENQVTFIVMGQSARSRVDEVVRGSIITKIMRETTDIDIVVVADPCKEGATEICE